MATYVRLKKVVEGQRVIAWSLNANIYRWYVVEEVWQAHDLVRIVNKRKKQAYWCPTRELMIRVK